MFEKNEIYWAFNLPLQIWPKYADGAEEGDIVGYRVLNYMPRKERVEWMDLDELRGTQTRRSF